MPQSGYTPIQLYYSATASNTPIAGNLLNGELAINIADGKLFYKDSGGVVQTIATKASASADVKGPASSTDNAVARFDLTTGKIIQNSGVTIDDTNNVSGVAQLNANTVDATTVEFTTLKAKDGTAAGSIANTTGVVTLNSAVLTTADINGGTVDGVTIGAAVAGAGTFTSLTSNNTTTLNGTTIPASKTLLVSTDIGVSVQAYDADTAKTDVAQTFTTSQRGTVTTDNDGSFDMAVTNNFKCTPTGNITLTFTNITAGQSGFVLLINGSNYVVSASATTKVSATALSTLSATGTYLLSYFSDGTNVFVVNSGALS